MDLCWQYDISVFEYTFSFVIAFLPRSKHLLILWWQSLFSVILEPKKIKSASFHFFFPVHLMWTDGPGFHDLSIFECWVLSQLFSLLNASWCSLVPFHFLPLEWYHLHIWGYWYFSGSLDSSLWSTQPGTAHDVLCIEVK